MDCTQFFATEIKTFMDCSGTSISFEILDLVKWHVWIRKIMYLDFIWHPRYSHIRINMRIWNDNPIYVIWDEIHVPKRNLRELTDPIY